MSVEWARGVCMKLPHATEGLQWGEHLLFRIGGKMFAIAALDPEGPRLSLKAHPEQFAELIENDGVIPAPYLARAKWISLERWDALPPRELEQLLKTSYQLVHDGLPRKLQAELAGAKAAVKKKAAQKKTAVKKKSEARKK